MSDNIKCTEARMLIRKPVEEVFQALIDPELTKNFWFTKGSGKLRVKEPVTWQWEMYNVSVTVVPIEIIKNEKIAFEWGDTPLLVEFRFQTLSANSTYVTVTECGYNKSGDELLSAIKDSTGGFTTVLDGLKAFMEHGINLNLIADKYPKELIQHGN
ncbi:MAG: SRPBCC family protein [Syntrophomonadaceae bacterium]